MKDSINALKEITDVLLTPEVNYTAIMNACASLSDFFITLIGFDDTTKENHEHILTSSGLAVGPTSAAFCIIDMLRTRNFLQGICEAIKCRLISNPNEPVRIFYGGTGPFATLIIPLTTLFSPAQLQMVLLEINPSSIAYLQRVIGQLELQSYIIDVVEADATTYSIPDHQQPDILVSETLKAGLETEPWISIVTHLMPQCKHDPILIPTTIKVEASLFGTNEDFTHVVVPLKVLMEFSSQTAIVFHQDKNSLPIFNEGVTVTIDEIPVQCKQLILSTYIHIFNGYSLGLNDCGITIPVVVMKSSALKKIPASVLFRYELGSSPGFRFTEL